MIPAMTVTEDTSVFQIKSAAKRKFLEKYDVNENDIQLSTNQNKRKKIVTERVLHPSTNEEEAMTLALLKEFQTSKRHDNICCNQRGIDWYVNSRRMGQIDVIYFCRTLPEARLQEKEYGHRVKIAFTNVALCCILTCLCMCTNKAAFSGKRKVRRVTASTTY